MMKPGNGNYGIRIGDSATVSAGAMAAGNEARAEGSIHYSAVSPTDLEELRNALSLLVEQLRASPVGVDDPDSLAEVAASAQLEARKERPNKQVLGGLLHAIMAGVENSATLASAVLTIQHAVGALL
jgi:hypothetical protein